MKTTLELIGLYCSLNFPNFRVEEYKVYKSQIIISGIHICNVSMPECSWEEQCSETIELLDYITFIFNLGK